MKQTTTLFALAMSTALSAQVFTNYTTADGLPTNNLRDVAIADNGDIWLASQSGVVRYDGTSFSVHTIISHPGLLSNDITAIEELSNGDVWAGTDLGVSVFDGTSYTSYTVADGLSDNEIKNIKEAPNGDVWLATINGATLYSNGVFTAFGSPSIPFGGAQHIAFSSNDDVYLSGGLGGVIKYDGSTFSFITATNGLISNKIRSIAIDPAGNKWVATARGISTLDANDQHTGDHTRPFILPAPDTLNPVTDIAIGPDGLVWAGVYVDYLVTEGGVSVYDGLQWDQYETVDGLAGPNVRRLAVTPDNVVWVTTSTGLTRINGIQIGINEQVGPAAFSVFPNPTVSELRVVLDEGNSAPERVEILDVQLRSLASTLTSNGRASIDVSAYPAGAYFVRIGSMSRRFVVVN